MLTRALRYLTALPLLALPLLWTLPDISAALVHPTPLGERMGLSLRQVEIRGLGYTRRADVLAQIDGDLGSPLLAMDLSALRAAVETLPWVAAADIERRLPGGLVIEIVERTPIALWQLDKHLSVIDRAGEVIEGALPAAFQHLPIVTGAGAPQHSAAFFAFAQRMPVLAARIEALVRVGERRWDVLFEDGPRVKLPANRHPYGEREAWHRLARLQDEQNILARAVESIDLRLADRLILRLTEQGAAQLKEEAEQT